MPEADSVEVPDGFTAWIEGPDGAFAHAGGLWSRRFSRVNVLEGVADPGMTRQYVERRVADWASRINALYQRLQAWAPKDWRAERRGVVHMHEELMRRFKVPARDLPVLHLEGPDGETRRIEPRGLWIIGANGRLDFFGGRDHHVILDKAETFAEPLWHIARLADRTHPLPLSEKSFLEAL